MPWLNAVLYVFSFLCIGLGVYAFSAKDSMVSLIAGGSIGVLMLITVLLSKSYPRWSRIASLLLAIAVTVRFLPKFFQTNDWIPNGTLGFAGLAVILCLLAGHLLANKDRMPNPNA